MIYDLKFVQINFEEEEEIQVIQKFREINTFSCNSHCVMF